MFPSSAQAEALCQKEIRHPNGAGSSPNQMLARGQTNILQVLPTTFVPVRLFGEPPKTWVWANLLKGRI